MKWKLKDDESHQTQVENHFGFDVQKAYLRSFICARMLETKYEKSLSCCERN